MSSARCASGRRGSRPVGSNRGGLLLSCFAALVLGGFVSLFTAGPALFADGSFAERPPILAVSVLAFALVGGLLGFIVPPAWKPVAVCLAVSAVPVVVVFGSNTLGQLPMMVLSAGFMLGDAAAGVFGAWAGARVRMRAAR